jgi:hypothetical protein
MQLVVQKAQVRPKGAAPAPPTRQATMACMVACHHTPGLPLHSPRSQRALTHQVLASHAGAGSDEDRSHAGAGWDEDSGDRPQLFWGGSSGRLMTGYMLRSPGRARAVRLVLLPQCQYLLAAGT